MPEAKSRDGEILIPDDLLSEYRTLRQQDKVGASAFYFEKLMPLVHAAFEAVPAHRAVREQKFHTLVSLMGFSPETTVLTAIAVRPKRLFIAYSETKDSEAIAQPGIDYLLANQIVSSFQMRFIGINAYDSVDIYEKLRTLVHEQDNLIIDITGGTKVMSATGGALAWELNLPICYLDGGWNANFGESGLQRVSRFCILNNPSRSRGTALRAEALNAYQDRSYALAANRFDESRRLISDSFFDLFAYRLCVCYVALLEFDRKGLQRKLDELKDSLSIRGVQDLIGNEMRIAEHLTALEAFAAGDAFVTMAGIGCLAEIYHRQGRNDVSGILWYRTMEAMVQWKLTLLFPGLNMSSPNWQLVCGKDIQGNQYNTVAELEDAYSQLGVQGSELPPVLGLVSGFALLSLFVNTLKDFARDGKRKTAIGRLRDLAAIRNRSYLAHGLDNLSKSDADHLREGFEDMAACLLDDMTAEFMQMKLQLAPRDLR